MRVILGHGPAKPMLHHLRLNGETQLTTTQLQKAGHSGSVMGHQAIEHLTLGIAYASKQSSSRYKTVPSMKQCLAMARFILAASFEFEWQYLFVFRPHGGEF